MMGYLAAAKGSIDANLRRAMNLRQRHGVILLRRLRPDRAPRNQARRIDRRVRNWKS